MEYTGERYLVCEATGNQPIEREHWQRYLAAAHLITPDDIVLDIACGAGYGSDFLAQTASHVYGIDISEETIQYAKETYPNEKVEFSVGSVVQIPLPNQSVNLVVSFETIEHVDENEQHLFLQEVKRVLRPNGRMIVSCPNKPIASDFAYELWGYSNIYHKKEYDEQGYRRLLEGYFQSVSLLYQRNEISLVLDSPGAKKLKVLWGERKQHCDTQNLIAVCGETEIDMEPLCCITPDVSDLYLENQRVLSSNNRCIAAQAAEIETHKNNISTLEVALAQEKEGAARLNEQIVQMAAQMEAQTKHIKKLLNSIEEATALSMQKDIALMEQLTIAAQKDALLKEQLAQTMCKDTLLAAQSTRIKMLEIIENSTIWRTTKPLRWVLDALKGNNKGSN